MYLPPIKVSMDASIDKFITLEPAIYEIRGDVFTVPESFIYDGASIPRVFWSLIGGKFHPDFQQGARLHDFMYRYTLGRKKADYYFFLILKHEGVNYAKAWLMYKFVRCFGWIPYDKYKSKLY
jgi:hypothetical protein